MTYILTASIVVSILCLNVDCKFWHKWTLKWEKITAFSCFQIQNSSYSSFFILLKNIGIRKIIDNIYFMRHNIIDFFYQFLIKGQNDWCYSSVLWCSYHNLQVKKINNTYCIFWMDGNGWIWIIWKRRDKNIRYMYVK